MKWDDITNGRTLTMTIPEHRETLLERQARERAELKAHLDSTRKARAWDLATKEYLENEPIPPRSEAN